MIFKMMPIDKSKGIKRTKKMIKMERNNMRNLTRLLLKN